MVGRRVGAWLQGPEDAVSQPLGQPSRLFDSGSCWEDADVIPGSQGRFDLVVLQLNQPAPNTASARRETEQYKATEWPFYSTLGQLTWKRVLFQNQQRALM